MSSSNVIRGLSLLAAVFVAPTAAAHSRGYNPQLFTVGVQF